MIGEVIQEYLVALGVQIDKPGFDQLESTMQSADKAVQKSTDNWAKNFLEASAVITTAAASITTSIAGVMQAAAAQDLQMAKLSRRMMIDTDTAWSMKKATDALGESVTDIVLTPELMERYKTLFAEGQQMKVGGDFSSTMRDFRDLTFQFTRLKQEASYAMTWVGYYLMKYLNRPLEEAKEKFQAFNDNFINSMSVWTQKAAQFLVYMLNVVVHFWDFIKGVTKSVYDLWDSFPRGIKIATAALTGFFLFIKASPLGKTMTLVSSLLLLIDDYFGYMDGKDAEFGKYWDKLNSIIETVTAKISDIDKAAEPFWDEFISGISITKEGLIRILDFLENLFDEISSSKELKDFLETAEKLGKSLWDLGEAIGHGVLEAVHDFMEGLREAGGEKEFKKFLDNLFYVFLDLTNAISDCIEVISELLRDMERSDAAKEFFGAIGDLADAFLELFNAVLDVVRIVFPEFFKGIGRTKDVHTFSSALAEVVKVFAAIIRAVSAVIRGFATLFKFMSNNRLFVEFWRGIGQELGRELDLIAKIIKFIGKAGQALVALGRGDFIGAARIAKEAVFGGGEGSNAGTGDNDWNAKVVYQRFKKAGYTDEAIAGIMGRTQQEHNFSTTDVPEQDIDGMHVGGYGMFQWNGGRKDAFLDWADRHNLDPQDPGAQADYAIYEAQQRGQGPSDMFGMSAAEAANFWTDKFEVGEHGYEQSYAEDWLDRIRSGEITADNSSGGYTSPDITQTTDADLVDRFNNFVDALQNQGYGVNVQYGQGNSIGFNVNGQYDEDAIQKLAKSFGLDTSVDDNGFYASSSQDTGGMADNSSVWDRLQSAWRNVAANGSYIADPMLYKSFMSGSYQNQYGSTNNSTTYQVNVGGITVTGGSSSSADEIASSVGDQLISKLESRGNYILQNRVLGTPILT